MGRISPIVRVSVSLFVMAPPLVMAGDLPEIKKSGVLRHLGIPYANFVTGAGDGMDVELMKNFARYLGVRYEYVRTDWDTAAEDLIGKKVSVSGADVAILGEAPVRGDVIANGYTRLPWREKIMNFSLQTFPSQIWLVARADSKVSPVIPSGSIDKDIARVRSLMRKKKILALKKTCLDPELYDLSATGADVSCFSGKLNELAPAIIKGEAEMTILDAPDALVALGKWPGKIKVIGPISPRQEMAVAFPKSSPQLLAAFDQFLAQSRRNGTYDTIVEKYYPTAFATFPEFFRKR